MKFPFNNLLVRKAFAYAMPYDKIRSNVFENCTVPFYGLIPRDILGYTGFEITKYEYNLTKAKELIEQSGMASKCIPILNNSSSYRAVYATISLLELMIFALPIIILRHEKKKNNKQQLVRLFAKFFSPFYVIYGYYCYNCDYGPRDIW